MADHVIHSNSLTAWGGRIIRSNAIVTHPAREGLSFHCHTVVIQLFCFVHLNKLELNFSI